VILKNKSNKIFLTGFMGSGKTTIGRALASSLSIPFFDLDQIIEDEIEMSIKEIFQDKGEDFFRDLETNLLHKTTKSSDKFIFSTGGGIVIREENRKFMRENGTIVFLYADLDVIFERIKKNKNRPLLNTNDPRGTLYKIWNERKDFYSDCDFKVDVTDLSIEVIVEKIKNHLVFL